MEKFFLKFMPVAKAGAPIGGSGGGQGSGTLLTPPTIITSPSDIVIVLCGILNWIFWGVIVISIIMFLVGGYNYATSQGDAEKVSKAGKTLMYAAIGVVVALIAAGVPTLIGSIFQLSPAQLKAC